MMQFGRLELSQWDYATCSGHPYILLSALASTDSTGFPSFEIVSLSCNQAACGRHLPFSYKASEPCRMTLLQACTLTYTQGFFHDVSGWRLRIFKLTPKPSYCILFKDFRCSEKPHGQLNNDGYGFRSLAALDLPQQLPHGVQRKRKRLQQVRESHCRRLKH